MTPRRPLFASVVSNSLEPTIKVVLPSIIVESAAGLYKLYATPKESFPKPIIPLEKLSTMEELATLHDMSDPSLIGVTASYDSPSTDFVKDLY
jgi:hypothetical protein